MKHYSTIIIGGGASGLYLAATLADKGCGAGVLLVESGTRVGRKLAAAGNGQGNVSNADMRTTHYYSSTADAAFIGGIIAAGDVLGLFGGTFTHDDEGRIYPAARQASTLVDILRFKTERGGVEVMTDAKVVRLEKGFLATTAGGEKLTTDRVVLAFGGAAAKQFGTDGTAFELARGLGHSVTPLFPAMLQLKTDTARIKTLKGVRLPCRITALKSDVIIARSAGEIIFTDYGITGNAVFALSAMIAGTDGVRLEIEFAPELTAEQLIATAKLNLSDGVAATEMFGCSVSKQLARVVVGAANGGGVEKTVAILKAFPLNVLGDTGFANAQVTRGGIPLTEVTRDLESRLTRGLYIIGEALDVTGDCGGYNLHWAFSTAKRVSEIISRG